MIEVIYSDENKQSEEGAVKLKLPRNVRQIGTGEENKKIYVEDYVITYIGKLWEKPLESPATGILLGNVRQSDGVMYIFISAAISVENVVHTGNDILFSDETWTDIYETIKKYFNDLEITGWFLARNDSALEVDESLYKTHIDNFAGIDKVLLLTDVKEKEEEFFLYSNGKLVKQGGYYIYYEKNDGMQAYMVEQKQGPTIDEQADDRVTGNYRALISEKKENTSQKRVVTALYSACTFLAVVVLAIGVTLLNNYDKMKTMEGTLNALTANILNEQNGTGETVPAAKTVIDNVKGEVETTKVAELATEAVTEAETEAPSEAVIPSESILKETETMTEAGTEIITEKETAAQTTGNYHIVLEGETLTAISQAIYQTDEMVDKIKEVNGIEDQDKIYPGQKIYLP